MEEFNRFAKTHFFISLGFLVIGLCFGFFYSINLLGFFNNLEVLNPIHTRSVHITLMLYSFIPLMLSYLPFLLMSKDLGFNHKAIEYLNLYTVLWYLFLLCAIFSLLFGVNRGLAFYDFHYSLNFILAFAGFFYIKAIFIYIKDYDQKPLWIDLSRYFIFSAPFVLLFLMNPTVGQVESTINGPHGDNTLGMSLALIPIYYLIIKYLSTNKFELKWNILWIIPTICYVFSILHRSFVSPLSYEQEWFFQWLTFLYIPLLYRWYKDANIEPFAKRLLLISILAFVFVDIEGNILFIDSIRWIFHRNDLIVAHAHVALGVGVIFMVFAMFSQFLIENKKFIFWYLFGIFGIFISLSIAGFVEAGLLNLEVYNLWIARTLFAIFVILSFFSFISFKKDISKVQKYHLAGILSDGFGALVLILIADFLYPFINIKFFANYEYVVFSFVAMTGVIHFFAYKLKEHENILAILTIIIRFVVGSMFLALFLANKLDFIALFIALFDFCFAIFYLLFFYDIKRVKI
jgi:hypothetical protein